MRRLVEPELLDSLPENDPGARGSRRDLQRLNWLMGHVNRMARHLQRRFTHPPRRWVDLGSGDGDFFCRLAERLGWRGQQVLLVDRCNVVSEITQERLLRLGWQTELVDEEVGKWLGKSREMSDVMLANLFLHHFPQETLRELLGAMAARTDCLIACEPRRSRLALNAARAVGLIGCNAVTRHDAVASVRAGFAEQELSQLWPREGWQCEERRAGMFTHFFAAERRT